MELTHARHLGGGVVAEKVCSFVWTDVKSNGASGDLLSQFLNHAMQMCARALNIKVLVLSCAALRGKQRTAVHLFEISIREFVKFLGIFGFFVVDSQMPLPKLAEAVGVDKLIPSWASSTPCLSRAGACLMTILPCAMSIPTIELKWIGSSDWMKRSSPVACFVSTISRAN
jgi:hypothetical protein